MAFHRVRADSDNHPIEGLYGFMHVTEATRFDCSPFGEIPQVEVKNDVLEPSPFRESESGAVIQRPREVGC